MTYIYDIYIYTVKHIRYIHPPKWQMCLAKMRFLCIKSVGWQKKTGGSSAIDGGFVRDLNTAGGIQVVGIATLMSLVTGLVFYVRKHLTEIGAPATGIFFQGGGSVAQLATTRRTWG